MSVESAIDGLLSQLKSIGGNAGSEAFVLVEQADSMLGKIATFEPEDLTFDPIRPTVRIERNPQPFQYIEPDEYDKPDIGEIGFIEPYEEQFTEKAEAVKVPTFNYGGFELAPAFGLSVPYQTPGTIVPIDPPEPSGLTASIEFTEPTQYRIEPLSGTPPHMVKPPIIGDFVVDMASPFSASIDHTDLAALNSVVNRLTPTELLLRLKSLIEDPANLPDDWHLRVFDQSMQDINAEHRQSVHAIDETTGLISGLPGGKAVYARVEACVKAARATMQARAKAINERNEIEAKYRVRQTRAIIQRIVEIALATKEQEVGWRTKALSLAMDGAEFALDLAIKALGLKEKEVGYAIRYNEGEIRRLDSQIKIEMSKLEVVKTDLANNKVTEQYNNHQLQALKVVMNVLDLRIKQFQTRVELVTEEAAYEKLKLECFKAEVAKYTFNLKVNDPLYAIRKAEIRKDQVLIDVELSKLKAYETDLKKQLDNSKIKITAGKAILINNHAKLEKYLAEAGATMAGLGFQKQSINLAIDVIMKNLDAEVQEQEIALQQQALSDSEMLDEAVNVYQKEKIDLFNRLKRHAIRVQQAAAQGDTINGGAQTLGSIAASAFSGLNAVATKEIIESA